MAGILSLEFYQGQRNTANGYAGLDGGGMIDTSQLPASTVNPFKGTFATDQDLETAHATGSLADYAYVTATNSFWYWDINASTPGWMNQHISSATYSAMTPAEQGCIQWIIISS
jgi:hypothetical protein